MATSCCSMCDFRKSRWHPPCECSTFSPASQIANSRCAAFALSTVSSACEHRNVGVVTFAEYHSERICPKTCPCIPTPTSLCPWARLRLAPSVHSVASQGREKGGRRGPQWRKQHKVWPRKLKQGYFCLPPHRGSVLGCQLDEASVPKKWPRSLMSASCSSSSSSPATFTSTWFLSKLYEGLLKKKKKDASEMCSS